MFYILLGILGGTIVPVQTGINTNLRRRFGSPFIAAEISFTVGFVFMFLIFLFSKGQSVFIPFGEMKDQPLWIWAGGLLGTIYLTGNILLMPKLGGVQTIVFPVFGLIVAGLVIDHFALFGAVLKPITAARAAGALCAFAGVLIITLGKHPKTGKRTAGGNIWLWRLFGILVGMCSGTQIAINGKLAGLLGAPLKAAYFAFGFEMIFMGAFVLLSRQKVRPESTGPYPWWIWIGGILGVGYIVCTARISPVLGTGFAAVLSLTGQMIAGILVDQFGLFRMPKKPVTPACILGILVMVSGSVLINLT